MSAPAALLGLETEHGLAVIDEQGARMGGGQGARALMRCAAERLPHLPGHGGGLFFTNASLLYVDIGNHPELATPECPGPDELVAFARAGDAMLASVAEALEEQAGIGEVRLFKSNVDYLSGTTWGSHESYLCRRPWGPLSAQIVPHLATRIVYTGAGGLDPSNPGIASSLSPRARFLGSEVSDHSTGHRGIFHTKDESLAGPGFHRLHVLAGDAGCSETSTWLRFATTALVAAAVEAGERPARSLALRDPVGAMQILALDPTCSARVAACGDAREVSAIEVQRHYHAMVESRIGTAGFPDWAGEVCRRWRQALDLLEADPDQLAATLDWCIKRTLFTDCLRRHELDWEQVEAWNEVLPALIAASGSRRAGSPWTRLLGQASAGSDLDRAAGRARERLAEVGLGVDDLDRLEGIRCELCELDARYATLGRRGLFERLDRDGALCHRVVGQGAIDRAGIEPPSAGRARVRGRSVRELAGTAGYSCGWSRVTGPDRVLHLNDPCASTATWVAISQTA